MRIIQAQERHASHIARLIMQAMGSDCCHNLMAEDKTLEDFESVILALVKRTDSQYSYLNALVAETEEGETAAVCVSYDGAHLRKLRAAFISLAAEKLGKDHTQMPEETAAGELYIDSIAVDKRHRRKGIASQLLQATIRKAARLNLTRVGLLVDFANPNAEKLYARNGFKQVGINTWGGHDMKHLQYELSQEKF